MAHPLVELSRTFVVTSSHLVTEDYDAHPTLCRRGLWVGWEEEGTGTVVLSYEHDPEELYVGWSINGVTVIDPGYSSGTWVPLPAPGEPSIRYACPVGGFFHRLSLASTPGHSHACVPVQVLYRTPTGAGSPPQLGPSRYVCVTGRRIVWPAYLLLEEQKCLERLRALIRRYVRLAHVGPGDPVEQWLRQLRGDDARRIRAQVETLGRLGAKDDPRIAEAIRADLHGLVRSAIRDATSAEARPSAKKTQRKQKPRGKTKGKKRS